MKYLLVTNSFMLPGSILRQMAENSIVVSLDGAANKLVKLGIKPAIIIGDFDSIHEDCNIANIWGIKFPTLTDEQPTDLMFSCPYEGKFDTKIVVARNQNFTDLQKALSFVKSIGSGLSYPPCTEIHIASTPGPRIDHELSNIFTLKQAYDKSLPIYLHEEFQSIEYVEDQEVTLNGLPGDYCGLFGLPSAKMSVLYGLEYGDMTPYELSCVQYSSSNKLSQDQAKVDIQGQALIIHPPMFTEQRNFFHKKRKDQLQEMLNDEDKEILVLSAHQVNQLLREKSLANSLYVVSHSVEELSALEPETEIIITVKTAEYASCLALLLSRTQYDFPTFKFGR